MSHTFGGAAPTAEQAHLMQEFCDLLLAPSADGGVKRAAGVKPDWRIDPSHERAMYSHLGKWVNGELVDADSGSHPLVHLAWRALAIAWQESRA